MKKRITPIIIATIMLISATACGNGDINKNNSSSEPETKPATEIATQKTTEETQYKPIKTKNKTNKQGLADNISDGSILHTWCWSFNTIKENLKDIAEAGFTTVQTSPANTCLVGEGGGME